MSAKLTIERERSLPTLPSAIGRIRQGDLDPLLRQRACRRDRRRVIELFWLQNWGRYPTNDLDMLVMDPTGKLVVDADGNPRRRHVEQP